MPQQPAAAPQPQQPTPPLPFGAAAPGFAGAGGMGEMGGLGGMFGGMGGGAGGLDGMMQAMMNDPRVRHLPTRLPNLTHQPNTTLRTHTRNERGAFFLFSARSTQAMAMMNDPAMQQQMVRAREDPHRRSVPALRPLFPFCLCRPSSPPQTNTSSGVSASLSRSQGGAHARPLGNRIDDEQPHGARAPPADRDRFTARATSHGCSVTWRRRLLAVPAVAGRQAVGCEGCAPHISVKRERRAKWGLVTVVH